MDLSGSSESFSGAPQPPPPLSGLQFGGMGFSGAGAGPDTGSISGGAARPGMPGGPGLDTLSLLAQLSQGGDITGGSALPNLSMFGDVGQGSLGQLGGLGGIQSPLFQQAGQQGVAGQMAGAVQPGAGSVDPLALLQKLLGLGQTGVSLFQGLQPSGTSGATQTAGGYSTPSAGGTASPTVSGTSTLENLIGPATTATGGFGQQGDTSGIGVPLTFENVGSPASFGVSPSGITEAQQSQLVQLLQSGASPEEIQRISAELTTGGIGAPDTGTAPLGGGGGGGGLSNIGTGLGGALGLLGLLQGGRSLASGNTIQGSLGLGQGGVASYEALAKLFPDKLPPLASLFTSALGGGATQFGQGVGALSGATGSEIGSALASGGLEGGTAAAETAASSAGSSAAGAAGGAIGALGSLFNIYQDATAKGTPDALKAANAAIDAAALVASFVFPPAAILAPVAKAGIGNLFRDVGGTGQQADLGQIFADIGPASGPAKALGSLFGADLSGTAGRVIGALDPITGPLSILGDLFGGFGSKSTYVPKRQAAGAEAGSELSALGGSLQGAAKKYEQSGNLADALAGLQTQFGERNPVRSQLTAEAAQQLGLPLQWSQLNPAQFGSLLDVFAQQPDRGASMLEGSGDVPYLPYAQAVQVANSAKQASLNYLTALENFRTQQAQQQAQQAQLGQFEASIMQQLQKAAQQPPIPIPGPNVGMAVPQNMFAPPVPGIEDPNSNQQLMMQLALMGMV